jgi:hypothetical protein
MLIIILALITERLLIRNKYSKKEIIYNRLDLIQPEKYSELLENLSKHLGFEVVKAKIGRVDLVKGQVRIYVYFPSSVELHEPDDG